MKILFLTHQFLPDIGGIEVLSEILADYFSSLGHDVHLLTWTLKEAKGDFNYKIIRSPGISTLFKEHAWADVVFENNPCIKLSWPNLFFRKPLVVALHTWIAKNDGSRGKAEKFKLLWLKRAKTVIACSDAIKDHSWPAALVIDNPYRQELFKKYDHVSRDKSFVFLGRLVSDKGVDILIKALSDLIQNNTIGNDFDNLLNLSIIGDGAQKDSLINLTKELDLQERITFLGAMSGDELVKTLNQFRYLVVPSRWKEPFGLVALEGMACGCIPIVSDGGGLPHAVGKAGLTFERGNAQALAETIATLLNNHTLENSLRNEAEEHLLNHQTHVIGQRYMTVIQNALTGKQI